MRITVRAAVENMPPYSPDILVVERSLSEVLLEFMVSHAGTRVYSRIGG
jgi:hypothetical protein